MKYKNIITLNKNSRGCYILDTVKGCSYCREHPNGCYGECYAANIARRYGFDFKSPVGRYFDKEKYQLCFAGFQDSRHKSKIITEIEQADMPFIRIGEMGDPSEDWGHTLDVCEAIKCAGKKIVIITKHWNTMTANHRARLSGLPVTINTSVSAMDTENQIAHRVFQYSLLGNYCNSILRVVTCDFTDKELNNSQNELLGYRRVIETIFRPSASNPLLKSGKIHAERERFLRKKILASRRSKSTYFGGCKNCPDMCGINY